MTTLMIRHRSVTKADIKAVMNNLSAVSKDELLHAELGTDEATKMMVDASRSSPGIAILERADPIAVLILCPRSKDEVDTMFLATERFFGSRGRPSLYLRKYLDRYFDEHPKAVFRSETYSTHPQLARWYDLMGYEIGTRQGAGSVFIRRGPDAGT